MDPRFPEVLNNVLTAKEIETIPPELLEKLKSYVESFFDEYFKEKASASRLCEYEQKFEELHSEIKDYEVKLQNYDKNVSELRYQLDQVSKERTALLEARNTYDEELSNFRKEKDKIVDERDSLLKAIERQNLEIDRIKEEAKSYQQQLRNAISAKCDAVAKIDEVQSKEAALEFKEYRIEQERTLLHNQIQTLSDDLNRQVIELQNLKRESTLKSMHLETRLAEKVEESKIALSQCAQYKESIEQLSEKVGELTSKMLAQNEEANKMMDFYKKELEAKSKLAELYKNNCNDSMTERSELLNAIADLQRMLSEASEQYGDLETKIKAIDVKHEQELDEKDRLILSLKEEILNANDLLKEIKNESVETTISKLAPSAAIASRLIKSDMSLTELYSLFVKSTEELEQQKRENSRLKFQIKSILQELNESAPSVKKREVEYLKLIEANKILHHHQEELIGKISNMEELSRSSSSQINNLERENNKIKQSLKDASRQICYLLKEVEQLRVGIIPDNSMKQNISITNTDEIISKKLVTFSDIEELQENNTKLLMLVREFTTKLEEVESINKNFDEASSSKKIDNYAKKIESMQETINQQSNSIALLVSKCNRYKKMYIEKRKNVQNVVDLSDEEMKETESNKNCESDSAKRVKNLEIQLNETKEQYKIFKEQYEYYIQEKKNNETLVNEQLDSMRSEIRALTSSNCKLTSSVEYSKAQIKLHQNNTKTYKQQISALESRNKNYETTIIKHEQTMHILKDEVLRIQRECSATETEANHLRQENRLIKDAVARLQAEKEGFLRNQQNQNLLLNNIEMIKSNLERSEIEGRARLEQRLDESFRELAAQRLRFQEKEDRFRETTLELNRSTNLSTQRLEEEKKISEQMRAELESLRKEVTLKTNQIDELSKKLQESLTPSKADNPITLANKRVRDLENKFEEAQIDIKNLSNDLLKSREHADQYYKMSQSAETELKNIHEFFTKEIKIKESQIKELKTIEMISKSRIVELESEIKLFAISQDSNTSDNDQKNKIQDELKAALQKLKDNSKTMQALRLENTDLIAALNDAETKYANEMVQHSTDIQELSKLKMEMSKIQDKMHQIKADRDAAQSALSEIKQSNDHTFEILNNEKIELEKRITDLDLLNSSLHNQIEALTSKLTIFCQPKIENFSTTCYESIMNATESGPSHSNIEDFKNCDQLLQIIKFVRKEKDLTIAKFDILKAENARLSSEHTMMQKRIDELKGFLNQERSKTESTLTSAAKHDEILRKIETLNAITDSNRILREERNAISIRAKDLTDKIAKLEDEIFPLQNQNREFSLKINDLTSENTSLRTEAIKWRQRANILVEKSNKNPEEFKRLQMERENLAKMLTKEKEILKETSEELNHIKLEKNRLETELHSINKQVQILYDEKKKVLDEINAVKQSNARVMQEIMDLKNNLLQKEETIQKLTEELDTKEAQLQDSKNKEIQIRKIAKRYKDSYLELSNKNSTTNAEINNSAAQDNMDLGTSISSEPNSNTQYEQRNNVENLNNIIRNLQEDNDKIRKDFDDLKASAEKEEGTKSLLRDATNRIALLQESNVSLTDELTITKMKLQSSKSQETVMNDMKDQYEQTIIRLENDLIEQNNLQKESNNRLIRENESLQMRITQLTRQFGLQQSGKPATSSVVMNDKTCVSESSRTANVKPMSGACSIQQSATVTPWRGSETPLASIRPISVQSSRTAAILPTSQQSTSSGSTSSCTSIPLNSVCCINTALVPPQQQVHTTGSSTSELMSTSPTSSHSDYMPSTSSASISVAAIPPMATSLVTECSQEAESLQHQQQSEPQALLSSGQQQAVALVSPRIDGSIQNISPPVIQVMVEVNQQPCTSGSTASLSTNAANNHNRHTPSSSNVTTTQTIMSGILKRPRETENDATTNSEECSSDKSFKHPKRIRNSVHNDGDLAVLLGVSDSGVDIEYQVPTSSQRDHEDDIVVVDSEEDDCVNAAYVGPTRCNAENEVYEDSYEQDENDCTEVAESNIQADVETDNNEVEIDVFNETQNQCTSAMDHKMDESASTSQQSVETLLRSIQQENHQQSQTISSGSCESNAKCLWKQSKQQKISYSMLQKDDDEDLTDSLQVNSLTEIISSPNDSKCGFAETKSHSEEKEVELNDNNVNYESVTKAIEAYTNKKIEEGLSEDRNQDGFINLEEEITEVEDISEEVVRSLETSVNAGSENFSGATQSKLQSGQENNSEVTSEDNEGADGVSSEGEKPSVGDLEEEEGREAEATTTPSINTRSKTFKSVSSIRRSSRAGYHQRGNIRPTPIIWQEASPHSRGVSNNQRNQELPGNTLRGFPNQRSSRPRRMRRATGYPNMRFS